MHRQPVLNLQNGEKSAATKVRPPTGFLRTRNLAQSVTPV